MIDIVDQISAISRQVTADTDTVAVTLQRRYPAAVADVWNAITDPDRVRRGFLPLTGELRPGGSFQLEGNASGKIIRCEPPEHLAVTFGGETSLVRGTLSRRSGRRRPGGGRQQPRGTAVLYRVHRRGDRGGGP